MPAPRTGHVTRQPPTARDSPTHRQGKSFGGELDRSEPHARPRRPRYQGVSLEATRPSHSRLPGRLTRDYGIPGHDHPPDSGFPDSSFPYSVKYIKIIFTIFGPGTPRGRPEKPGEAIRTWGNLKMTTFFRPKNAYFLKTMIFHFFFEMFSPTLSEF